VPDSRKALAAKLLGVVVIGALIGGGPSVLRRVDRESYTPPEGQVAPFYCRDKPWRPTRAPGDEIDVDTRTCRDSQLAQMQYWQLRNRSGKPLRVTYSYNGAIHRYRTTVSLEPGDSIEVPFQSAKTSPATVERVR
jgi:hypothetical protein